MISRIRGTLLGTVEDRVEVATAGGVVYEVVVPLTVQERLPAPGAEVELRTAFVVRDDSQELYGFMDALERELFHRILGAGGIGAKIAVAMLSTFRAPRLARAIADGEVAALVQVPGIGKKKAERLVLDLADRVAELADAAEGAEGEPSGPAGEAVQALVALGMAFPRADELVRAALREDPEADVQELIRRGLARS